MKLTELMSKHKNWFYWSWEAVIFVFVTCMFFVLYRPLVVALEFFSETLISVPHSNLSLEAKILIAYGGIFVIATAIGAIARYGSYLSGLNKKIFRGEYDEDRESKR